MVQKKSYYLFDIGKRLRITLCHSSLHRFFWNSNKLERNKRNLSLLLTDTNSSYYWQNIEDANID
jgi:hypothetical protein